MSYKVYINNKEADVIQERIRQTFQSNDLLEINDRNISHSNVIKFPFTPNNVEIFSHLRFEGNTSTLPYDLVPARIQENGSILIEGFCKVTRSIDGYYEGMIREEEATIFDTIKDKNLSDLDLSAYDHYLNVFHYQANCSNTQEYTYAIADNGVSLTSPVNIAFQSPSMFYSFLWEEIWSAAGFTYHGEPFNEVSFKSELVQMESGHVAVGQVFEQTTNFFNDNQTLPLSDTEFSYEIALQDNFNDYRLSPAHNGATSMWIAQHKSIVDIDITNISVFGQTIFSSVTGNVPDDKFFIKTYKNGVLYFSNEVVSGDDLNLTLEVDTGDKITMKAVWDMSETTFPSGVISVTITFDADSISYTVVQPYIKFSELLPDISQTEFIKEGIAKYGMMYRKRKRENTYDFILVEDLLNDRENAEDWSDKIGEKLQEQTSIGDYGILNTFEYQYPDNVKQNLDWFVQSTNLNQAAEKNIFQSIFYISAQKTQFLAIDVLSNELWELKDGVYEPKTVKPRIAKNLPAAKVLNIIDGAGHTMTLDQTINYQSHKNLDMKFYTGAFFKSFGRILNSPKKPDYLVYLNTSDIENRDFFKLKYIAREGKYYYLNKIKDYNSQKVTAVELIEVVGFTEEATRRCESFGGRNDIDIIIG